MNPSPIGALAAQLRHLGMTADQLDRVLATFNVASQALAEQEDQCVERLLLGAPAHPPFNRQLAQKSFEIFTRRCLHFPRPHKIRQPPGPLAVGLLGAPRVVLNA